LSTTTRSAPPSWSSVVLSSFRPSSSEMTESPVLIRYVRELCLRCGLTLALHRRPHSSDCAVSEHLAIIDALLEGDIGATRRIMSDHLRAVVDRALVEPPSAATSLMDILAPYTRQARDRNAARRDSWRDAQDPPTVRPTRVMKPS
jgi:hypothetical protein